ARALINEPPLILADEPTGDLDEESEAEVFRLLLGLHRERGATLLLVTHNPNLAREADRIIHVRSGRILAATVPEREAREVVGVRAAPAGTPVPDGKETGGQARRGLVGLGSGFGQFLKGVAVWAAVVVLAALLANYGTALYQQSRVAEKKAETRQL